MGSYRTISIYFSTKRAILVSEHENGPKIWLPRSLIKIVDNPPPHMTGKGTVKINFKRPNICHYT